MTAGPRRRWAVPSRLHPALRFLARASLASAALVVCGAVAFELAGARLNYTSSLPRGLYLASEFDPSQARRGDLVEACPTPEGAEAVAAYLPPGRCPGGVLPLGKRLAAVPGDVVVLDSAGLTVDGVRLDRTAPLFRHPSGAPLFPWLGRHVLGPGEFWLLSDRVPTSIDSRYVGPVTDVRGRLRPLWVSD